MRRHQVLLAALAAICLPLTAAASPVLLGIAPGVWTVGGIADGTSNTIRFGESTRVDVCVPNAAIPPGITDGTSNTIRLTESQGLRVRWVSRAGSVTDGTSNTITLGESQCFEGIASPSPIAAPGDITDGTSNTIVFGENPIDLRDRAFDVCFSNAQYGSQVTDGTSNTIVFGETVARRCYRGIEVADALTVAVPVPAPAALPLLALAILGRLRRRSRR